MAKLSISRKAHINVGNFNNIESAVHLELDDLNPNKLSEIYKQFSEVLDSMLALENHRLLDEIISIKENPEKYSNALGTLKDKIQIKLEKDVKKLNEIR